MRLYVFPQYASCRGFPYTGNPLGEILTVVSGNPSQARKGNPDRGVGEILTGASGNPLGETLKGVKTTQANRPRMFQNDTSGRGRAETTQAPAETPQARRIS